jgi:hypothetical protein
MVPTMIAKPGQCVAGDNALILIEPVPTIDRTETVAPDLLVPMVA